MNACWPCSLGSPALAGAVMHRSSPPPAMSSCLTVCRTMWLATLCVDRVPNLAQFGAMPRQPKHLGARPGTSWVPFLGCNRGLSSPALFADRRQVAYDGLVAFAYPHGSPLLSWRRHCWVSTLWRHTYHIRCDLASNYLASGLFADFSSCSGISMSALCNLLVNRIVSWPSASTNISVDFCLCGGGAKQCAPHRNRHKQRQHSSMEHVCAHCRPCM